MIFVAYAIVNSSVYGYGPNLHMFCGKPTSHMLMGSIAQFLLRIDSRP